jgi:hypothetical protein
MVWKLVICGGYTLLAMRLGLRAVAAMLCLIAAGGLPGCGSGTGGAGVEPKPMPVIAGGGLSKHAPRTLVRRALPAVGVTQRVDSSDARLAVTLRRVIDPLRGSGADLPPHTRAVAVIVEIRSSGPALYDSSATGDISLMSSAGVTRPALATRGICRTPQNDFDRYITPGEHRSGCVVFIVADGATLDAVRFSPHAHPLGRLTWAP